MADAPKVPERSERLERLYEEALDLPTSARAVFLDEACRGDSAMREELASLLADGDAAEEFLEAVGRVMDPSSGDPPPRLVEALAGRYAITRAIGHGGMATVYLADDLRHERKVAIKVLRPEVAAVLGADRFLSEIKTTANLQHPHILALHDSGDADGFLFYVMPYIDGESLRDRLEREQQLAVEEAVRIARDVADALDCAHRNDVIHRDIKPANILLHEGRPMVADFGIALAISAAGRGRMTETGLSLGTPHYMSPEQVSANRDLSARSDVYSLGCVLYEMLVGQPPHTGPSTQSVLVRILTEDPRDVAELRHTVPPNVAAAVMKSIEKLPADRFDTARQFMDALEDSSFTRVSGLRNSDGATPATAAAPQSPARLPWHRDLRVVASLALAAAATAFGVLRGSGPQGEDVPTTRAVIDLGDLVVPSMDEVVISPDGSVFAVVAETMDGTDDAIYVRNADEEGFRPLPGTSAARFITFSPGSEWIAFRRMGPDQLMKVSVSGGAAVPVIPRGSPMGVRDPHWADNGTIVFTGSQGHGLYRVSENGGTPELLFDAQVRKPNAIPGGRFIVAGSLDSELVLFDLEGHSIIATGRPGLAPKYVETGHLLYVDPTGQLWAAPFDPRSGALGEGVPLESGIRTSRGLFARYSVSRAGTAVFGYGASDVGERYGLATARPDGTVTPIPLRSGSFETPRWSPSGDEIAYSGQALGSDRGSEHVFIYDAQLNTAPRQITVEGTNADPVWSPDGTRIAFSSLREGTEVTDLFVKDVLHASPPERILSRPGTQVPFDWPNDTTLLFWDQDDHGLWVVDPTSASDAPECFLDTRDSLSAARVDPLGKYVVYQSAGQGGVAIHARPFPGPGQPALISEGGNGVRPAWAPAGDAVYYLITAPPPTKLVRADLARDPLRVLSREVVELPESARAFFLDVHPDGDRFVIIRATELEREDQDPGVERHVLVVNWFDELRERMGEGDP